MSVSGRSGRGLIGEKRTSYKFQVLKTDISVQSSLMAQLLMPVSGRVQLKGRGLLDPTWLQDPLAGRVQIIFFNCTPIGRVQLKYERQLRAAKCKCREPSHHKKVTSIRPHAQSAINNTILFRPRARPVRGRFLTGLGSGVY